MAAAFKATVPDLVRSQRKDDCYAALLAFRLHSLAKRILGARQWLRWQKELDTLAQFLYFAATSVAGLQTLGEEYVGLVHVDGETGRLPSFKCRLCFVLLQVFGPYFFEKSIDRLILLSERRKNHVVDRKNDENDEFCDEILQFLRRSGLAHLARFHLALFYVFGLYYGMSKRLTRVRYLTLRGNTGGTKILATFKLFGCLSLAEMAGSALIWALTVLKKRQQSADGMAFRLDEHKHRKLDETRTFWKNSNFRCCLCLSYEIPPACTPCGHLFCWNCAMAQASGEMTCAICRSSLLPSRIIPIFNY